jgi:hypothetical protein
MFPDHHLRAAKEAAVDQSNCRRASKFARAFG